MDPAPDTERPDSGDVDRLTDELVLMRRRGVERIDRSKRVPLPILEALAAQHSAAAGSARPTRIRHVLDNALKAYEQEESSQADAAFVRSLLADPEDRWPGPGGSGALQQKAQDTVGIHDDRDFRKYQRERFSAFVHYLLTFSGTPTEQVPPPAPPRQMRVGRIAAAATTAAVVIGGVILGVVLSGGSPPTRHHRGTTGAGSTTPSTAAGRAVSFRFDNLGSTYPGGNTLLVYPGASTSAADRQSDGEYPVGDVMPAICVTTGRLVKSDPTYHETPKQSDQWVRIASTDGQDQYATLTYGELIPRGATLPQCVGSGG